VPKSLRPRPSGRGRAQPSATPKAGRDIVDEIRRAAKPAAATEAISRFERAVELLERGDPKGAAAEGAKAKSLASRSPAVREVLGMALYGLERWEEALQELKAYKRMSRRVDQNHLIADCLRALGRPAEAVPLAEEELRMAAVPNEAKAEAVIVAASALADLGRHGEALALLRRAKTREDVAEPYTLRLWYVTGEVLARLGRPDEAAEQFRKVVRHDPGAFDAAERLAQLG
jgi:tetratricopeptide (TPR) repeat protein